jgi:type I restriction enzyme S subunit
MGLKLSFIIINYINFYFLELLITFSNLKKYSSSTAQPVISGKKIYPIIIPVPPLEEQKRIVEKIEELLPYIEEYGGAEEKLEELNKTFPEKIKVSILQEAFQGKLVPQDPDDVPAKGLLAQIQKEKEQLIKDKKIKRNNKESVIFRGNGHFYEKVGKKGKTVCIDEEIPFDIPDTWEWVKLKDIIELGENLNIHTQLNKDTIINYVDIKAIDNKNYCIKEEDIKIEKVNKLSSRARRVLEKDQIVYSTVRPYLNNIAILTENKENYIGTTGLMAFKTLIETKYVFYYLLSPVIREYYLRLLKGFNSPSITQKQFLNTYIPIPPLNEQERIVDRVEQIFKIINELEEAILQDRYIKDLISVTKSPSTSDIDSKIETKL